MFDVWAQVGSAQRQRGTDLLSVFDVWTQVGSAQRQQGTDLLNLQAAAMKRGTCEMATLQARGLSAMALNPTPYLLLPTLYPLPHMPHPLPPTP